MVPGIKFNLGGTDYIIPHLTIPQLGKVMWALEKIIKAGREPSNSLTSFPIDAYVEIIHTAMLRNYPQITREEIGDWLDLENLFPLLSAALGPHANFKGRYPGLHLVRSKPTFRKGKD